MKTGKVLGPSVVSSQLIAASREEGIQVVAEICWRVTYSLGILVEWSLGIVVPIFKTKGDIRNCCC